MVKNVKKGNQNFQNAIAMMSTNAQNGATPKSYLQKITTMEECKHEIQKTVVVHTTTTCETTVTVCAICNKWLDKPKTNC